MGMGHVNLNKAADPSLVYEIEADDYICYSCSLGYSQTEILAITRSFERTVTNVGDANSSYQAEVVAPPGERARVKPTKLSFAKLKEKKTYRATFSSNGKRPSSFSAQDNMIWHSGSKYHVRSPITVHSK
ncbi:hypothetical protein AMTR_s00044p00119130 [Amborella trichopoda]|uniref:Subtilisin-like protease fibronectin type-III domain-containing protein n=1 Tax=Amborella trichopoda TaxID=13333 RepID=U5D4J2_AMBTC|nr:hypothetical protein AMTR_s00044p00119130 [Amborella trichopoda]